MLLAAINPIPFDIAREAGDSIAPRLWDGLKVALLPAFDRSNTELVNLLNPANVWTPQGNLAPVKGRLTGDGVGDYTTTNLNMDDVLTADSPFTFCCVATATANRNFQCLAGTIANFFSPGQGAAFIADSGGASQKQRLLVYGSGTDAICNDTDTFTLDQEICWGGRYDGDKASLWRDGLLKSESGSGITFTPEPDDIGYMAINSGATNFDANACWEGSSAALLVWNRALTDAEMFELGVDPWCLLRPIYEHDFLRSGALVFRQQPRMAPQEPDFWKYW